MFYPGQRVMCVSDREHTQDGVTSPEPWFALEKGRIYTVSDCRVCPYKETMLVQLEEMMNCWAEPVATYWIGVFATRFRPVTDISSLLEIARTAGSRITEDAPLERETEDA